MIKYKLLICVGDYGAGLDIFSLYLAGFFCEYEVVFVVYDASTQLLEKPFSKDVRDRVLIVEKFDELMLVYYEFCPSICLIGTSVNEKMYELMLVKEIGAKVTTLAYVDFNSNLIKRFSYRGEQIKVGKYLANGEAVKNGLFEKLGCDIECKDVNDSVRYYSLARQFCEKKECVDNPRRAIFISQPVVSLHASRLNEFGEISEYECLNELVRCAGDRSVYVKMHPRESIKKYAGIKGFDVSKIVVDCEECGFPRMNKANDVVVGLFSKYLDCLAEAGFEVYSVQNTNFSNDFYDYDEKLVKRICLDELESALASEKHDGQGGNHYEVAKIKYSKFSELL